MKKANTVNNGLTLNVYEQQDDIKHLKEHLKEKALCVTCNPSIATTNKSLKNIFKKSSCKIIMAKCLNKERK